MSLIRLSTSLPSGAISNVYCYLSDDGFYHIWAPQTPSGDVLITPEEFAYMVEQFTDNQFECQARRDIEAAARQRLE